MISTIRRVHWYQDQLHMNVQNVQNGQMFDHSAPSFNPTIQRRTIGHRKMSQVSKQSAWQAKFIGTKISSIWTFKMCRTAKMFDHSAPLFKAVDLPHTASQDTPKCSAQWAEKNAPFETSWAQLTAQPTAQQTICSEFISTGRSRSSRHGKCPRNMNMVSLKINSLVFSLQ